MPATAAVRRTEWADAVFDAVGVLRAHMSDPTSTAGLSAARELLRLEATRMRHGGTLAGTYDGGGEPPFPATDESAERERLGEPDRRGLTEGPAVPQELVKLLAGLLPVPPDATPDELAVL